MIRIPYPIQAAARTKLIAAGIESCAQLEGSTAKKKAREMVDQITKEIRKQYGKKYDK